MATVIPTKARMQQRDWLNTALAALAEGGINAIAIEKLAEKLGVTRGSFYYHFKDRDELLQKLLNYWEQRWTVEIGIEITALGLDPRQSLLALVRMIRHRKAAQYDTVFRSWALHDAMAREVVKRVDEYRLGVIRDLFERAGFEGLDAENRARLLLYYEVAEPTLFAKQRRETRDQLVEYRLKLLTTAGPDSD